MKHLIVGLGNIGNEYKNTRHNVGFKILDAFAQASNFAFSTQRYGDVAYSRYWKNKENIELENILVIVDDLSLPFGAIRLKGKGSDGGHNGLKNIAAMLQTESYARLRFGIGNDFPRGAQVDYVLGKFSDEQQKIFDERAQTAIDAIKSFCLSGLSFTMTHFNNK